MAETLAFADLLASATRSPVHLDMRDGYGLSTPAFIAWQQGHPPSPAPLHR